MAGSLIRLPLRLGLHAARVTVSTGLHASGRAVALVGQIVKVAIPGGPAPAEEPVAQEPFVAPVRERDGAATTTSTGNGEAGRRSPEAPGAASRLEPELPLRPATGEVPEGSRPTSQPAPLPSELSGEPAHVSEEPVLVEEFAEPGAEDGAGAAVTMDEPWDGYDGTPAGDLIVRLQEADAAELAAVKLYEQANRRRETVLTAVDREFQNRRVSGPPN